MKLSTTLVRLSTFVLLAGTITFLPDATAHADALKIDAPADFSRIEVQALPIPIASESEVQSLDSASALDASESLGTEVYDSATGQIDHFAGGDFSLDIAGTDFGLTASDASADTDLSVDGSEIPTDAFSFGIGEFDTDSNSLLEPFSLDADAPGEQIQNFGSMNTRDASAFPYRMNTKLFVQFPWSSGWYACSGALIEGNHILTSGACAYSHSLGGWYSQMIVIPGYDNGQEPFGRAYAIKGLSWNGWIQNKDVNYNMAVVRLNHSIGHKTGYFGFGSHSSGDYANCSFYRGNIFNMTSYPLASFAGNGLALMSGTFDSCRGKGRLEFNRHVYSGMTGAPAYRISGGQRYIEAVQSYSVTGTNKAGVTRIDNDRFYSIRSFING